MNRYVSNVVLTGLAALILAVGVACSGGAPGAPYPSVSGAGAASLPSGSSATITMAQTTGLGVGTASVTGTGTVTASQSVGNPSGVPALQLAQRSLSTARRDASSNTPVAYVTITASTASTISQVALNVAPTSTLPSGSFYLAFWNGSQWVTTGSTAKVSSAGVITVVSSVFNPPISLAAGASFYLAVYTGQIFTTPTPEPSPPVATPNPLSISLLSPTQTVDVITNAGLQITASSSNTGVATVTASATAAPNGEAPFTVTAQNSGTATLTFTDPIGQKTTDVVTVNDNVPSPVPAPSNFVISAGDATTITVSTADNFVITATSSNTAAATITASATANSSGAATFTLTGVASGVTTLTFKDTYGDTDTTTVDVSPVEDGSFATGFNNPSGTAVWSPCSYNRTSLSSAINASPAPYSGNSSQAPPASTTPVPVASVTNLTGVVTPPPNLNPNELSVATPSASNVALVGGSPAPAGAEMASVTEGAVGICQTWTLDSTNEYLTFWVYETAEVYNFYDGDQEAAILGSANGSLYNTTTPDDSYLFAEENCLVDPGVIGLSTVSSTNDCYPASLGGSPAAAKYQGGYWVQKGPYNLSTYATVGQPLTLYFGVWYYETKAPEVTYGMAMFIANVQVTNSTTFPSSAPYNRHRGVTLALPTTRARAALAGKALP